MVRCLSIALLGVVAFVVGCGSPREEGLIVNLQTDYAPSVEFDHVRVELDGAMRREVSASARDYARPRFVTTFSAASPGRRSVAVALMRGMVEVARRTIEIPFEGNYLATVVITRSCNGVVCTPGNSCFGARCIPDSCVTGTEPSCPPPLCTMDTMCMQSAPCVRAECVAGACLESPDASACAATEACVPGVGCVALNAPDAGAPDGGAPDAFTAADAYAPDAYAPDANVPDAFIPVPSFTLHYLAPGGASWTTVVPRGDFPTTEVEAAFTAHDGTMRVMTHDEVFSMTRESVFTARVSRASLFPEIGTAVVGAADRIGGTLTLHHGEHTGYTWSDVAAPGYAGTVATSGLPMTWRGPFAPSPWEFIAAFSFPDNAFNWARPDGAASCGMSIPGRYTGYLSYDGFGPRQMRETTYDDECSQFVASRPVAEFGPLSFPSSPALANPWEIDAVTYAGGLYVFTSPE